MNHQRLLQRFLRYVKIDTTAREEVDDYPSSPGQIELGRLLIEKLRGLGIDDARQELYRGCWWQLAAATLAIGLISLALNIVGDALRDALDPKLRQGLE